MTGNIKSPPGFTLLEAITVTAIFGITVVSVLNLYLIFFKTETQVEQQITVESDARFVLSSLTSSVQVSSIDYDYYGGTVPTNPGVLALLTPEHETIRFRFDTASQTVETCQHRPINDPCDDSDPSQWAALNNPASTPIQAWTVWVSPSQNPFERNGAGKAFSNSQPMISVVVRAHDKDGGNPVTLQTTFTSRAYER